MNIVRPIVVAHVEKEHDKATVRYLARNQDKPRLHPSDVGHCPRRAIWNAVESFPDHLLHADKTHPFDFYVKEVMRSGVVWEAANDAAFTGAGASHHDKLTTDLWSGETDFILEDGTIVEHKDTAGYNFKAKDRLPYDFHCVQLLVYQELKYRIGGVRSPCILYYNGRGSWAEFKIWIVQSSTPVIRWEGEVNGNPRQGLFEIDVLAQMGYLERCLKNGNLPPKYSTPLEKRFACVKQTKKLAYPSCQYCGVCWPEIGYEPFVPEDWGWES